MVGRTVAREPPMTDAVRNLYADFIRTFGNVLFAVSLFVVWGILTLIGVIVDQGKAPSAYYSAYAAPIARAILRLDFNNVYHSWWYVGIIALILTSLAVCTFKRVIPARLPALRPVKIDAIPLHATIDVAAPVDSVRANVERFFAQRGFLVRNREFGGIEWSFADKQNWARRGVLIAHLGFVIIAAGTTLYWAFGFSGDTAILTGQTVTIPRSGATIHLDRFRYRIDPIATKTGIVYQPIDYVSHVMASGKDGIAHPYTIRVNHPINIDGTNYYQSSYGFAVRFTLLHNGRVVSLSAPLYAGDTLKIPGTSRSIEFLRFVPTMDPQTKMPSPDPRIGNPAVALSLVQSGTSEGAALVLMHRSVDVGDGWSVRPQRYLMFTGIQYRYDPGVDLVGIGAFVLLVGLIVSFYFLPARFYVRVDAHGDGAKVGLAATTVKGYDIFAEEFGALVERLRTSLQPGG